MLCRNNFSSILIWVLYFCCIRITIKDIDKPLALLQLLQFHTLVSFEFSHLLSLCAVNSFHY